MDGFIWFITGFAVAQFIGLITTTTPEKAAENLIKWGRLIWPQ